MNHVKFQFFVSNWQLSIRNFWWYLSLVQPLCNVFKCSGAPGKVLRVHAAARMDPEVGSDIVETMKSILETAFPRDVLGLGGVVLVKKGKWGVEEVQDWFPHQGKWWFMWCMTLQWSQSGVRNSLTLNGWGWKKLIRRSRITQFVSHPPEFYPRHSYFFPVVTNPPATLDLRPSHTHGFNDKVAGHYHYDTTPLRVE